MLDYYKKLGDTEFTDEKPDVITWKKGIETEYNKLRSYYSIINYKFHVYPQLDSIIGINELTQICKDIDISFSKLISYFLFNLYPDDTQFTDKTITKLYINIYELVEEVLKYNDALPVNLQSLLKYTNIVKWYKESQTSQGQEYESLLSKDKIVDKCISIDEKDSNINTTSEMPIQKTK